MLELRPYSVGDLLRATEDHDYSGVKPSIKEEHRVKKGDLLRITHVDRNYGLWHFEEERVDREEKVRCWDSLKLELYKRHDIQLCLGDKVTVPVSFSKDGFVAFSLVYVGEIVRIDYSETPVYLKIKDSHTIPDNLVVGIPGDLVDKIEIIEAAKDRPDELRCKREN